jgi:Cytidylate kinase-like family
MNPNIFRKSDTDGGGRPRYRVPGARCSRLPSASRRRLTQFDEVKPTFFERFDVETRHYMTVLQSALLDVTEHDNAVIMGRSGQVLLQGIAHVLRMFVRAPFDVRVRRVTKKMADQGDSVAARAAAELVRRTDQEKYGRMRYLFDVVSPEHPVPWLASTLETADAGLLVVDLGGPACVERVESVHAVLHEKRVTLTHRWEPAGRGMDPGLRRPRRDRGLDFCCGTKTYRHGPYAVRLIFSHHRVAAPALSVVFGRISPLVSASQFTSRPSASCVTTMKSG